MTENSTNQGPTFANVNLGSPGNNIFGIPLPVPIYNPQIGFYYPFPVFPNMWPPNVEDAVIRQRISELGPNFVAMPPAILGQMDSEQIARLVAPRKESVIVTAKPDGGVVPLTLNQDQPSTSSAVVQSARGICFQGKLESYTPNNETSNKEVASTVDKQEIERNPLQKHAFSRTNSQQGSKGFAELDIAQILVNDMPVPVIGCSKSDSVTVRKNSGEEVTPLVLISTSELEKKKGNSVIAPQETDVKILVGQSCSVASQPDEAADKNTKFIVNEDEDKSCSFVAQNMSISSNTTHSLNESTCVVKDQQTPNSDNCKHLHNIESKDKAEKMEETIHMKSHYQRSISNEHMWSSSSQGGDLSNQESSNNKRSSPEIVDGNQNHLPGNQHRINQESSVSLTKTGGDPKSVGDISSCNLNISGNAVSEDQSSLTGTLNNEESKEVPEMDNCTDICSNGSSSNEEEVEEMQDETTDELREAMCTGKMAYKCEVCLQLFRSPLGLQKHLEFHTHDGQHYTCTSCFERFDDVATFESHVATHMKKRPHKCNFCPKAFRDPGSLQKHVRVHTGEKPYKCTSCFRSFAEYSSLRKHLRVHTGKLC